MKLKYICNAGTLKNMLAHLRESALAFLVLFIGICTVQAAVADTLRVGMTGQYMPLHGEEDGKKVGFEVDVAHVLGQQLGKQVVFVSRSELGMGTLQAVAEGKVDIGLSAITPTSERRKIVDLSAPIGAVRYRVVHDGGPSPCEKEVYAAQGPAYEAAKRALGVAAKSTQDDAVAIQMVQAGKARCAIVEEPSINKLTNPGTLRVLKTAVGEAPIAIAVPKGKLNQIRDLLLVREVSKSVVELQQKWDVRQAFNTYYDSLILPYAEWPLEIRTSWVVSPDFGTRYIRELRDAYQANKLFPALQDLTKNADQETTVAVMDSLIKLAGDHPDALETFANSNLAAQTSVDGKKQLVLILHFYLLSPQKERQFGVLSGISTSIQKANATRYVELHELLTTLCKPGGIDSQSINNSSMSTLLGMVFQQTPMGDLRHSLREYYDRNDCSSYGSDVGAEGEARQHSISWYEHPITYALATFKDWRFTERLLKQFLQDIVSAKEYGKADSAILMSAETIAMFNPRLTKKLEPLIVEAKAIVYQDVYRGGRDSILSEYRARAAQGSAIASAETADAHAWAKMLEYKTKFVEPRIYDRRDSKGLVELPAAIRNHLEKNHPPEPAGTGEGVPGLSDFNKNFRYRLDVWDQYSKKIIFFAIYHYGCASLSGEFGECKNAFFYDPISKKVGTFDLKSEGMIKFCKAGQWPFWDLRGILDLNKDGNPEAFFQCSDEDSSGGGYSYQEWKAGKFTSRKLP